MSTGQAIKQSVYQAIDELPSESFEELSHFLDFLKFKYQVQQPRKVVALGGLWKHLDFDVTDAEVRALRMTFPNCTTPSSSARQSGWECRF